jgi:hypothetical protein
MLCCKKLTRTSYQYIVGNSQDLTEDVSVTNPPSGKVKRTKNVDLFFLLKVFDNLEVSLYCNKICKNLKHFSITFANSLKLL